MFIRNSKYKSTSIRDNMRSSHKQLCQNKDGNGILHSAVCQWHTFPNLGSTPDPTISINPKGRAWRQREWSKGDFIRRPPLLDISQLIAEGEWQWQLRGLKLNLTLWRAYSYEEEACKFFFTMLTHMLSLNYHVWEEICQSSNKLIYCVLFKGHTSVRQVLTLTGSWIRRTDARM